MSETRRPRHGLRRWAVPAVVVLAALVAASAAVTAASPSAPSAAGTSGAWVPRGLARLNLTEQQLQQIAQIRQKAYEQAIPLQGELYTARQQLALALRSAQIDANRVKELAARIHDLQGQLQQIQIQMLLDIHGVLTDEQRAQLSTLGGLGGLGLGGPWGLGGLGWGRGGFGPHMMGHGWRR